MRTYEVVLLRVQCCSEETTMRPSHLMFEAPTQPGITARKGKP